MHPHPPPPFHISKYRYSTGTAWKDRKLNWFLCLEETRCGVVFNNDKENELIFGNILAVVLCSRFSVSWNNNYSKKPIKCHRYKLWWSHLTSHPLLRPMFCVIIFPPPYGINATVSAEIRWCTATCNSLHCGLHYCRIIFKNLNVQTV